MKGYGPASYGDGFADVYDDWYPDVTDVDATVRFVTALVPGGRVLELGIGTGRIALPLVEQGAEVTGIDASEAMLEQLAAKRGADRVRAVHGDMAQDVPDGPFDLVLATYNTFFNLTDATAQLACARRVAEVLRPGGRLVLETFVPSDDGDGRSSGVTPRTIEAERVVLTVSRRDAVSQRVDGQMIELSDAGIRLRPWSIRYLHPDQLDALAAEAGLELEARFADWRGTPFDPEGPHQVVVYRRPALHTGAPPDGEETT